MHACVRVEAAYISELPYNTGRLGFSVTRAVLHPNGSLAINHLSTQLRHRVETDLLVRCVFKILEQERDVI